MAFPTRYPLVRSFEMKLQHWCYHTQDAMCGFVRVLDDGRTLQLAVVKEDGAGHFRIIATEIEVSADDLELHDKTGEDLNFDGLFYDMMDDIECRWSVPVVQELH